MPCVAGGGAACCTTAAGTRASPAAATPSQEGGLTRDLRGLSPRSSRTASANALRAYQGPSAFAIPGNHDWIDGLETFIRYVQHRGWLGGWLLPQVRACGDGDGGGVAACGCQVCGARLWLGVCGVASAACWRLP